MAGKRQRSSAHRRRWPHWVLGGLLSCLGCASPPGSAQLAPPEGVRPAARPGEPGAAVWQVKYEEAAPAPPASPTRGEPACDHYPINLATALRLAGANNLQIALADERVRQAQAVLQGAEAQWLPTLHVGAGYNKHEGLIQDTQGQVLEVSRNSLFVGGGPLIGDAPLNGGTGGPPRLFVGIPLAEALFAPLVARQAAVAAGAARAATFNDTLLQVGLAYQELLSAYGQQAVAREAVRNARELLRLVESRVRAGTAIPADRLRIQAELAERLRQEAQAEEAVQVASAELARLLRLDPAVVLLPADGWPAPVHLVEPDAPLPALLAQGLSNRPELAQNRALIEAALARLRRERARPWLPAVQLGLSTGGFGGGEGSSFNDFGGRLDFDALLVWELRNLGVGNRARQRERASEYRQASLAAEQTRDVVITEVVRAYRQVRYRLRQMEAARSQVKAAAEALPLNFKGILEGALRAVEAQQAVQALTTAQAQYLAAIIAYNRAQLQLLRAIGQPLDAAQCLP